MTNTINTKELLTVAYIKYANAAIAKKYNIITMKESGIQFKIYEGYGNANYEYEIQFLEGIKFSGGIYRNFTFKDKESLGKFLFDMGTNGGYPKNSIH